MTKKLKYFGLFEYLKKLIKYYINIHELCFIFGHIFLQLLYGSYLFKMVTANFIL